MAESAKCYYKYNVIRPGHSLTKTLVKLRALKMLVRLQFVPNTACISVG